MAEKLELTHPWLVAVWPGMGHVALNAGVYLLAKLGMSLLAEFDTDDLFDVNHVEVKHGLIQMGKRPRNRLFLWSDPEKRHDLIVFLGEVQPPLGKHSFCRQLITRARRLGVERVFTFAAMAGPMLPGQRSRVFGAATDQESLEELKRLELELLEKGQIGGLNGVLLGVAAEEHLHGACLLGEMPHIFAEISFPKASLAILEAFAILTGINLDLGEMAERVQAMEQQLSDLLAHVDRAYPPQAPVNEEEFTPEPTEESQLAAADRQRIEILFAKAAKDRSKAFELKQELDRLGVFKDHEDRFLELFKQPGKSDGKV